MSTKCDELLKRCRNVVDVVERDLARCSCFPQMASFSKIDDGAVFVVIYWREIFFWACVLTRCFWCQIL